jgi:hypothetical protein
MRVKRQDRVDLQFEPIQIFDQVDLAADGQGQRRGRGRDLELVCLDQDPALGNLGHQEPAGMRAVVHFMNFDLLRTVRENRAFVDAD